MKLLALRLASFRRFSKPVALEGFIDGINLIAGPNESGKSTLYNALEAAFLVRHNVSGGILDHMRPRAGGEPLVEADFETANGRWRIRKQFGRGKSAMLTDLATGKAVAKASEAEDALNELIGVSPDNPGRAGLVWVRQQRTLQPPDPDHERARGERVALLEVIGEEVIDAAGSGYVDEIIARARAALEELESVKRGQVKKGGAFDLALRARDDAKASLAAALNAEAASDARLNKIAELVQGAQHAAGAESANESLQRIEQSAKAVAEAEQIRARRNVLRADLAASQSAADLKRERLVARERSDARRDELAVRIEEAKNLETDIKSLAGAINANPATPQTLARLGELAHLITLAEASASAPGAIVSVALLPEGGGKVTVSGSPVASDSKYAVSEKLRFDIAGIGSIEVEAEGAVRAAAARNRRDTAQQELSRILTALGANSIEGAKEIAARRNTDVHALDAARARLSGLAPKGSVALEAERGSLGGPEPGADTSVLQNEIALSQAALDAARQAFAAADATALDDEAFARLQASHLKLKREMEAREQEARRNEMEIARLKSEQAGFDEDGRAAGVEKARGLLERSEAVVKRVEGEIAALRLLIDTLEKSAASVRTRFLDPVARAVSPYLSQVFPDAQLAFGDGFSLAALVRAGEQEDFAVLSDGTREQLAVLVRMAFAEVMSYGGAPVPLVLDDPLVYSDDRRLEAMFAALAKASARFQVVMFTCREKAFGPLSGARLQAHDWTPL